MAQAGNESKKRAKAKARPSAQKKVRRRRLCRSYGKLKRSGLPTAEQLEEELRYEQYRHRYSSVLRSTVYTLVVVAALSVLAATLFLPVLRIYGTSMTPTVSAGDIVVSVKGSGYQRGDLVSFYYQNSVLVKRVIATGGDWVDIDEEGNVYVNGARLEEPYLEEAAYGTVTISLPYQVGEGRVFVMGDHRSTSIDSRAEEIGCVAEEYIIGKIVFRIWPLSGFGFIG